MHVGIPTEIKNNEYRVAITPVGVAELVAHGRTHAHGGAINVASRLGRGSTFRFTLPRTALHQELL